MVIAKTELFDSKLQTKAAFFKALAHPARIQIICYLAQNRICLSGDISGLFPLDRTTLNQHIRELKNAGLIEGYEQNGKIYYCLVLDRMNEMNDALSGFLAEVTLPEDFCCECGNFKHTYQ